MKKTLIFALVVVMILAMGAMGVSAAPLEVFATDFAAGGVAATSAGTVTSNPQVGTFAEKDASAVWANVVEADGVTLLYNEKADAYGVYLDLTTADNVNYKATVKIGDAAAEPWYTDASDASQSSTELKAKRIFVPLTIGNLSNSTTTVVVDWAEKLDGKAATSTINVTISPKSTNAVQPLTFTVAKIATPSAADLTAAIKADPTATATEIGNGQLLASAAAAVNAAIDSVAVVDGKIVVTAKDEKALYEAATAFDSALYTATGSSYSVTGGEVGIPLVVTSNAKITISADQYLAPGKVTKVFGADDAASTKALVRAEFTTSGEPSAISAYEDTVALTSTEEETVGTSLSAVVVWLNPVTATFNTDGGTAVDPITVAKGTNITEPTTTKEGYTRVNGKWYQGTTAGSAEANFTTGVTADFTAYALWTKDEAITPAAITLKAAAVDEYNDLTNSLTTGTNDYDKAIVNLKPANEETGILTVDDDGALAYTLDLTFEGTGLTNQKLYCEELNVYKTLSSGVWEDLALDAGTATQTLTFAVCTAEATTLKNGYEKAVVLSDAFTPITVTVNVIGNKTPAVGVDVFKTAACPATTAALPTDNKTDWAGMNANWAGMTVTKVSENVYEVAGTFKDFQQSIPLGFKYSVSTSAVTEVKCADAEGDLTSETEYVQADPVDYGQTSIYDDVYLFDTEQIKSPLKVTVASEGKVSTTVSIYINEKAPITEAKVNFVDGETVLSTQTVKVGEMATKPADPTKTGAEFLGWYADAAFTTEFDFTKAIDKDTTVYAKFDTTAPAFTDLGGYGWAVPAINWAVENGITNGAGGTLFAPGRDVTRQEFVTFLYRYAGNPEVTVGDTFKDVDSKSIFAPAIYWAADNNITTGTNKGGTLFSPAAKITREQMATFIARYVKTFATDKYPTGEWMVKLNYTDVADIQQTQVEGVTFVSIAKYDAAGNTIMNGVGDGTKFAPKGNATRAMAVTVIYRMDMFLAL